MTAEKIPEDRRHLVSEPVQYQPSYLGHIMYCGRLIPARSTAACFMMFDSDSPKSHEIPQSLRLRMRPCAMIQPDLTVIVSTFLCSWGYPNSQAISHRFLLFVKFCETQIASLRISLKTILITLQLAVERYYNPALSPEFKESENTATEDEFSLPQADKYEASIVFGLTTTLQSQFESAGQADTFKDIIRDIFPLCSNLAPSRQDADLVKAINEQLKTDGLEQTPALVDKVLQLNNALEQSTGVIRIRPRSSGKTVVYRTLCLALNKLHSSKAAAMSATPPSDSIEPSKPLASLRQNLPKLSLPLISTPLTPPPQSSPHSQLLDINEHVMITPLASAVVSPQLSLRTTRQLSHINYVSSQVLDINEVSELLTDLSSCTQSLPANKSVLKDEVFCHVTFLKLWYH
ncbi:DNHD1 [Bugula neritina]|uniref:DNHD1 n=1 Tax=Bugula neritina TaxID=10212 RepID=A0A7J7KDC5_BUGNE|nr:DNHD1 [Bugula neritina]